MTGNMSETFLNTDDWIYTANYKYVSLSIHEKIIEKGSISIPDSLTPFFTDEIPERGGKEILLIYSNKHSNIRDYFNAKIIVKSTKSGKNTVLQLPKSLIYQIFIDVDEKYSDYLFSFSKEYDDIISLELRLVTDIDVPPQPKSKKKSVCQTSSELAKCLEDLNVPLEVSKAVSICARLGTVSMGEARKELSFSQGDKGRIPFELAEDFGYVRSYLKKNSRGKVTTYYTLCKSTDEIYEDIEIKNFKTISDLHSIYDGIDVENDTDTKLIKKIISLGIPELKAKVALTIHQKKIIKDSELLEKYPSKDAPFKRLIRDLFSSNWICTDNSSDRYTFDAAYMLREPLEDLLYAHVISQRDLINVGLNELKQTFASLPKREMDFTDSECSKYNDSDMVAYITRALDSNLVEHTVVAEHILDVNLSLSLLKKVRIYHFPLIQNTADYMIDIRQLGKSQLEIGLDASDASLVVICGYEPELELFAFWDAYSPFFSSIKHKRQLTLYAADLYSGLGYGIKNICNQKTKAILVSDSYHLSKALEVLYDHYLST